MQKTLITAALPYANGPLHFGHIAGSYLPADCYARFCRLKGDEVLFICGSDEYGIAVTLSAEMAGRTPKEHVDLFHGINDAFFQQLNISFDHYSRTTWPGHIPTTQQFFQDLLANGYIEERITEQLYAPADEKFLADRYVVGTCPYCGFSEARGDECPKCGASYEATDLKLPRSKLTGAPLESRPTKHWFLLLDKFKDSLQAWLKHKEWKPNVINFAKAYIEDLRPRAITRDMTWGVPLPLPDTDGKVLYVWFDAPIGYISATKEWAEKIGQPERWRHFWQDDATKLVNFMGKDNIPFHAAIFPAMIMGQNQSYKLVDELPANEFYNLEGRQFSKSDGWYIDLKTFFENYAADQIRYAIAANAPETSDAEFSWKDFQLRCNGELVGKFGNLINRVLVFAKNHCQSRVPPQHLLEDVDKKFLQDALAIVDQIKSSFAQFKVRKASQHLMELAQLGNVYFDAKHPWKDAKEAATRPVMENTIACCLRCLQLLALSAYPVMPSTADKLWTMLGFSQALSSWGWQKVVEEAIPQGQQLQDPQILFHKIEEAKINEEIEKLYGLAKKDVCEAPVSAHCKEAGKESLPPLKSSIEIEEVRRLDLRVGTVVDAEPIGKSKKLLKLSVDLGFEVRTVVAGIKASYSPQDILGKKVVVVANLKPTTLMGVESQGMLLAGSCDDVLEVVTLANVPNGSVVS